MSSAAGSSEVEVKNPPDAHLEIEDTADSHNKVRVVHTDGTIDYVDAKAVGGEVSAMPPGYFRSAGFIGTVVAQCLGNICAYTGWVLPANTLSLINADLGNSPNIAWVATAWTLGSCIGFLLVGRLSDIFGRRYIVLACSVLSLIGCIIGSTAQSVEMLIAASTCNGISAAGQLSFGIFLGELVPNKMRGPIIALVFASSGPFAVFGPSIARAFISNTAARWRWSFYLGDIFAVLALLLNWFLYHPPTYDQLHVGGKTTMQQLAELDYVGIVLFIAGSVLFLIGLSWGGVMYPWVSGYVLGTLVTGIAVLIFFGIYEAYICKKQPLMPPRLFRNVGFVAIVVIAAVGAMVYYSLTVIWPTLVSTIYTPDAFEVGLRSSVIGGGILLGQILAGLGITYVPKVKWQAIISACLSFAFITSLVSLSPESWTTTIALATVGLVSIGYIDNISFPGVTLVIEPQDIGLATGVMGSLRALAGAIAQALYVSVQSNKLADYIPQYVVPAATAAGLPESSIPKLLASTATGDFSSVPGISDSITAAVAYALKQAYAESFKIVFYCTIPFSIIMIIGAAFVPNMESVLSNNVAKKLQNRNKPDEAVTSEGKVAQDV